MGYPDPNAESPSLQLVEATHLRASADASLNAIKVEIIDPVGSGIAFLISPRQVVDLTLELVAELGNLLPGS
jgi:hypothetical protein